MDRTLHVYALGHGDKMGKISLSLNNTWLRVVYISHHVMLYIYYELMISYYRLIFGGYKKNKILIIS